MTVTWWLHAWSVRNCNRTVQVNTRVRGWEEQKQTFAQPRLLSPTHRHLQCGNTHTQGQDVGTQHDPNRQRVHTSKKTHAHTCVYPVSKLLYHVAIGRCTCTRVSRTWQGS
eukprot:GDKI01044726.1.p1 GENE.GDKI01044726.1~~GDKI01044726.1.p1  ORF type:complete len:111 (+),score=22.83 GDKI01044726.1:60-392(+)